MADQARDQLLFSYGALNSAELQLQAFGRVIDGEVDHLPGYTADYTEIEDTRFADLTGLTVHPMLRRTGNPMDKVFGRLLPLTEQELDALDQFQVSLFRRASVVLGSGRTAWIYVPA